ERIRGPAVEAALRLRMALDPEYLGVPLPGETRCGLWGAGVDADLEFLGPDPRFREEVEIARRRTESDMARLERLIDGGLLERAAERLGRPVESFQTPEHRRAAAVAYSADFREVRRHLSAQEILSEVYRHAPTEPLPSRPLFPRPLLWRTFRRFWKQHGRGGRTERAAAWRVTLHNHDGAADALRTWHRLGEEAAALGERRLAELLAHPGRITEQLLTLRAVQTLTVLDVLSYREHVYHLGRYEDEGDTPGALLEWKTVRVIA
ncbi:MAG: hypothetical protein ACREJB_09420, partial [Planctomycetaceae bacterium]